MNGAFEIGQTGLVSLQRALDILANNITNMNTQGFKRSDVRFSEIIAGMSVDSAASTSGVAANASNALTKRHLSW